MRVARYARVSTEGQDPVVQLSALRAHVTNQGWEIVEEFGDHGYSGAKERTADCAPRKNTARCGGHGRFSFLKGNKYEATIHGQLAQNQPNLLPPQGAFTLRPQEPLDFGNLFVRELRK